MERFRPHLGSGLLWVVCWLGLTPIVSAADGPSEPGIPVTNAFVQRKCGVCHKSDAQGRMGRISWERTTPEGWEQALKRMVRLNGLTLKSEEAKEILAYLSTHHGLAPEEAAPIQYIAEHRLQDEKVPEPVQGACTACHLAGVPMSWRRSKEDWKLLVNMHLAYFPVAEFGAFTRDPSPLGAPDPPPTQDKKQPVEKALEFWGNSYKLQSPAWSTWHAAMRSPKLAGHWLLSGSQPGKGRIAGEVTITADGENSFRTETRITYIRSGQTVTRSGRSTVYTGYAWRGRSSSADAGSGGGATSDAAPDTAQDLREVMMLSRDQNQMSGRWFWGAYQEFGMDVHLVRDTGALQLLTTDLTSLRSVSSKPQTLKIYGNHLPADLTTQDVDFGKGVTVSALQRVSEQVLTATVVVDDKATPGPRDLFVKGASIASAVVIFDHVDYLKVSPDWSLARLGGNTHPKGYFQFEAIGYDNGPDQKPNTPDDICIGPLPARWSLEEFLAVYGDDDREFVGKLNGETGLFSPAAEGPNPKREHSRNNYGDVWVVAELTDGTLARSTPGKMARPLTAKSYLVVAVPQYLRWDQPEVAP